MRRLSVPLTAVIVLTLITLGCGGTGGGVAGLDIGPGPGPVANQAPLTPAVLSPQSIG